MEITKINEEELREVDTHERIIFKSELVQHKATLEEELAVINSKLAVFDKPKSI